MKSPGLKAAPDPENILSVREQKLVSGIRLGAFNGFLMKGDNMRAAAKCMFALLATISCAALATPTDPDAEDFNPFTKSYVSRIASPASPHRLPKLYAGSDKDGDYYRLLEDGYDMLGYSSFKFTSTPPEKLSEQAASLNADLVLVYTEGVDSVANRPDRTEAKAEAGKDETLYEYFATYWTKLATPLLGLHVQRENPEEDAGLEVLAVIKQSPAAQSGLQRGDVLVSIGDMELHKPEQLGQAAERYSGKTVEVKGRRDGENFAKVVTLNQR